MNLFSEILPEEMFLPIGTARPGTLHTTAKDKAKTNRPKRERYKCSHCSEPISRESAKWEKGLCFYCYCNRSIRRSFKIANVQEKGYGGEYGEEMRPLPEVPTQTLPGSEERILVFTERARMGLQLFHPQDKRDCETLRVPLDLLTRGHGKEERDSATEDAEWQQEMNDAGLIHAEN